MSVPASVIVPTHNRPAAAEITVAHLLASAERAHSEVVVVDDGSAPPLALAPRSGLKVLRTSGVERSRARNTGACGAEGRLLIFVDDDIAVAPDFVEQHLRAEKEFGNAIWVGRILLPREILDSPFGRFRRTIEEPSQTRSRGLVEDENFCTAANMSMRRSDFLSLGGFDPAILSGEDQDLALRFSAVGGRIIFVPEAEVVHRDSVTDFSAYGRRHEWGARAMAPFLRRHAGRAENVARLKLAASLGDQSWGEDSRLLTRLLLSGKWPMSFARIVIKALERAGANDAILFPFYRSFLGLHLFRGFRAGLSETREAPPLPASLVP